MEPRGKKTQASQAAGAQQTLEVELRSMREACERATAEIARLKDLAGRAQADLQNARARMEKEAQEIRAFAFEGVLRKLLPTVDNLKRAFQHVPEELKEHEWIKGMQVLEQALLKDLADLGMTKIEALGEHVDPMKHEVLQVGPGPKDQVTEVFEDGYELRGKVLRPAKVIVGNGEELPA